MCYCRVFIFNQFFYILFAVVMLTYTSTHVSLFSEKKVNLYYNWRDLHQLAIYRCSHFRKAGVEFKRVLYFIANFSNKNLRLFKFF